MVSMNNLHFQRWSEQLRDSGHEVFWFDILDQGYAPSTSWITQITGWKKGFLNRRGRTFLKKHIPKLYKMLETKYDTPVAEAFEQALLTINPDVVHSFALQIGCLPILSVMNDHQNFKWIYSSWGSDLYNRKNKPEYLKEVPAVLKRVDYLFTDCKRDYNIAQSQGFNGVYLGVFPGGGGFEPRVVEMERKTNNSFALKAYQNDLGRAITALEALYEVYKLNNEISVYCFGASPDFFQHLKNNDYPANFLREVHEIISYENVMQLMERCDFYIGNSISDGIPNTMIEAMFCGCIPIQSNPGEATAELIEHGINGWLINDPENKSQLIELIGDVLVFDKRMMRNCIQKTITPLNRNSIKNEVLNSYENTIG